MYGEMGSPYLIPLIGWNESSLLPLKSTTVDVLEMQLIIRLMILAGKPKCFNTILTKLHSKRFYAFSRSIFTTMYPSPPFLFFRE